MAIRFCELSVLNSFFAISSSLAFVRWWCSTNSCSLRSFSFPLAKDSGTHIEQPHDSSSHTIADDVTLMWSIHVRLLCQLKTQTAIDDAERDYDSAQPNVAVGPNCSSVVFLECEVMDEAQERLEKE